MLEPGANTPFRRYRVEIRAITGKPLPRTVVTQLGLRKAVALAMHSIDRSVSEMSAAFPHGVSIEDLGPVGLTPQGLYDLRDDDLVDRNEF